MKWKITFCATLFLFFLTGNTKAQSFENAGDYLSYINKSKEELTATYLSYMSAVAHNRARKVEKRRMDLLNTITETRFKIQGMPAWKGDKTFRDSSVAYIKLLNNVFNEDYAKIVNMEEIAEQSYDLMEAYMLAQEKVQEKLQDAAERQNELQKKFAATNNINLIAVENELDRKGKEVSALMKHYDEVYLVFFKPYKQEMYLIDAVNRKNVVAIEENKNSLKKFAEEGLKKLPSLKGYNNDPSIIVACREALQFYKNEADQTQVITDFVLKEENFNKAKKAFDSKPAARRTKTEVDDYNKAVNDFNEAVNNYNKVNKQINKDREKVLDNWNRLVKKYLDDYMPVQRKA
ncbi:MAG TPA: hypothetical protein VL095_14205 [Flavisolibacter sp.]|nr:hypothetical protein [Flavisolibacter sp.]